MIIAPGKRSAARGNETKNEHLPFSCFVASARAGLAKQEKKGEWVFLAVFPGQRSCLACPGLLSSCPFRAADGASMKWIVRFGRSRRLHLTADRLLRLWLSSYLCV